MQENTSIESFLYSFPLYKKLQIDDTFLQPLQWYGKKFQFYCDDEEGERTFKMVVEPDEHINESTFSRQSFLQEDKHLDYTLHTAGVCQSCGKFKVHFLLNCFSDSVVDPHRHENPAYDAILRGRNSKDNVPEYNPKFFVRKVGQLPSFTIKPDKEVDKFLNDDDKDYYRKALTCISTSYGIAAYSYLRRIVETEVVRIVEHLIAMDLPEKEHIQAAYEFYLEKHQMDPFLVRVDEYLPKELKVYHSSPLRVLYSELSLGIHSYEDELCLKNAEITNELLIFIIKTLNTKERTKGFAERMKQLGRQ